MLAVATDAVILNRIRNLWARSGLQARPASEPAPAQEDGQHAA